MADLSQGMAEAVTMPTREAIRHALADLTVDLLALGLTRPH
jgi:hypothetical protein